MLPISVMDLGTWMQGFAAVFLRISTFMLAAPIFGAPSVSRPIRIVLAALISLMILPNLAADLDLNMFSPSGYILAANQVLLGLAMAFILQMVFAALVLAGQIIAMTMGLGFAMSLDPQNGIQVPVVSQFYVIMGTLMFLVLDLHLFAITFLFDSFSLMPLQLGSMTALISNQVVIWGSQMFVGSLLLGLPVLAGVLLINISFGVMTRAAPQLNIFAVGFPITIMAGFSLMLFSLPSFLPVLTDLYESAFSTINAILQS